MAPFTFAAGNAAKALRLPLYGLGAIAAALVPRSDRVWVFGSGTGPGEGALPLYRAARERLGSRRKLLWLAGSAEEARAAKELGLAVRRRGSPRGLWATLRAQVAVVTHGLGDVNRYGIGRAFVVQLWHGIPLKRLHLDSPETMRLGPLPDHARVRGIVENAYRRAGRRIGLFPVASALVADRIASAFGIEQNRVVVTGDPRDDVLFEAEPGRSAQARARIEAAIGPLPEARRLVLYSPTWRDGRPDPGVPSAAEWDAIAKWATRTDAVLLLRAHPMGAQDYSGGPARSARIRELPVSRLRDLTPVLPAVDILITDYSSVAFDFSLLERPTVFLAPDVEDYAQRRGLYSSYREFSGGRRRTTWEAVLAELDSLDDPASPASAAALAHARWLRDEHIDPIGGGATERVLDVILARLAAARGELHGPPPPAPMRPRPRLADPELVVGADSPEGAATLRFAIDIADRDIADRDIGGVLLDGGRARIPALLHPEGDRLRGIIPLALPRWGSPPVPLPSGDYRLLVETTDRVISSRVELDRPTASVIEDTEFFADARPVAGGFRVRISAPLGADEAGPHAQAALEAEYRHVRGFPENAVFFESFYSQSVADNPLGIDRALARLRPGVRRYWSVVDRSIPVPPGAIPLVEGSREWWRVRAAARVLVVNDWLRKRFRRRPHQHVLQTWHGTMLKRLALDRPRPGGLFGWLQAGRTRAAILLERRRWDVLLAQNEYSAARFRSAYAMDGPIWVEGYPRNDVLHAPDADQRAARVRAVLGATPDDRIVLYAPTWRDDRRELVDYLDAESFAAALGPGRLLVVRGHSRTLAYGHDLSGPGLVDATSYPDLAELLLVADVLITDYSSVMFDWMGTGRPILFFAPDLARYSSELRGFYFDLTAEAPGPILSTPEQVHVALRAALGDPDAFLSPYAERYAAWRERFTPFDDGRAGERVVRRMIEAGWLE